MKANFRVRRVLGGRIDERLPFRGQLGRIQCWILGVVALVCLCRATAQGTISINSATGARPRITFAGVNALPDDHIWVEVLVAGSTNMTGAAAKPFQLTLTGSNAGLFSKGTLNVWDIAPGSNVEVTIRAWQSRSGETYGEARCRESTRFVLALGGVVDANGNPSIPNSIVGIGRFTGLSLCSFGDPEIPPPPPAPPMTSFGPLNSLEPGEELLLRVVESATALDLNQDGNVDCLVTRVGYYQLGDNDGLKETRTLRYQRAFLSGVVYGIPVSPNRIWFQPGGSSEIKGANITFCSFPSGYAAYSSYFYYPDIIMGWVVVSNGIVMDYGYGPLKYPPDKAGLQSSFKKSDDSYEYEVADAANALLPRTWVERPIVLLP